MNPSDRYKSVQSILSSTRSFPHTIWLLGCGAVGCNLLYLIHKTIKCPRIIIIDKDEKRKGVANVLTDNSPIITFITTNVNRHNYTSILTLSPNDILIDCAYLTETYDLFNWCNETKASYVNSAIGIWDDVDKVVGPFQNYSIKHFHDQLITRNKELDPTNNFIICHGMNPGVVSYMAKCGLLRIKKDKGLPSSPSPSYAELASTLGIRTIHISEKDTQISSIPRNYGEYCNTWSYNNVSMYDEAMSMVEFTKGTHEGDIGFELIHDYGHYVVLKRRGMSLYARSYTPISGMFIGMLVPHDENITIGKTLSTPSYRPSVYYVYHPSSATMESFYELKENNMNPQTNNRLLTNDIKEGADELGLTFFLADGSIYWIGSLLDIEEVRGLFDNKINGYINATTVPVAASYLSCVYYLIDNIDNPKGLLVPDDLPCEKMMKVFLPFMGPFVFKKVEDKDWNNSKYNNNFESNEIINVNKMWQFKDFIVDL